MATTVGSGNLLFEPVENWEKLPPGWEFIDVAGVAVDSKDNVYAFNRSEHPVVSSTVMATSYARSAKDNSVIGRTACI